MSFDRIKISVNSKIKVVRTNVAIDMLIPRPPVTGTTILVITFTLGFFSVGLYILGMYLVALFNAGMSGSMGVILFMLGMTFVVGRLLWKFCSSGITGILSYQFQCYRVRMSQSELSLSKELFGWIQLPITHFNRSEITNLQIKPSSSGKNNEGDDYTIPAKAFIWKNQEQTELEIPCHITEQELEQIIREIAAWSSQKLLLTSENITD